MATKIDESLPDLGDLEREVMQLVWANGAVTAEVVREQLSRFAELAVTDDEPAVLSSAVLLVIVAAPKSAAQTTPSGGIPVHAEATVPQIATFTGISMTGRIARYATLVAVARLF